MSGMSLANGIKVAAAAASTALGASTFGQGAPEDGRADALRAGGASSLVDGPGVGAAPKVATFEMKEVDVGGTKVLIGTRPLRMDQDGDQIILGGLDGGSQILRHLGLAGSRSAISSFQDGHVSFWDVTNNSPHRVGSLTLLDTHGETQIREITKALKDKGATQVAIAGTHGSERGAIVTTIDNVREVRPYHIPSLRRNHPGSDNADARQFQTIMPGVMIAQFGLELVAAAQAPAPQQAAPTTLSAEQLQAAAEGRYEDQFGPALRGDRLSRGTLQVKSVQDEERILLNEYRADVRAVSRSAIQDLRQVRGSISAGVVSNESRIVAVRMGMSPEDAAKMTIVQLPALATEVEKLINKSRGLDQEYARKISGLR